MNVLSGIYFDDFTWKAQNIHIWGFYKAIIIKFDPKNIIAGIKVTELTVWVGNVQICLS